MLCVTGILWMVLWPKLIRAQLWLPGRIAPPFAFPLLSSTGDIFSKSVYPAFSALDKDLRAGVFVDKPLQLKNFRTIGAAVLFPFKSMVFYTGITDAGNGDFHQYTYGIGMARKAGELSIAGRVHFWSQSIRGYGSQRNISMEVNVLFPLVKDIFFFADVSGLGSTVKKEKASFPLTYSMGLLYRVSEEVECNGIWKKTIGIPQWMEINLYYQLLKNCSIHASYISGIQSVNIAVNYRLSLFSLAAGIRYQPVFGLMSTTAVAFQSLQSESPGQIK